MAVIGLPNDTLRIPISKVMPALVLILVVSFQFEVSAENGDDGIVLVFLGDIVFDGAIGQRIDTYGVRYPFEKMGSEIDDADLTFANLETPVSTRGAPEEDKYCTFRSDPETIGCLEYVGIDAVSLANNHCLDYGYDALNDTMLNLDDAGIEHAGIWFGDIPKSAHPRRPVVLEAGGLSFGFLAYTEKVSGHWMAAEELPGPMPLDEEVMELDIRYAKGMVDVLIVSIHWRKWPQYTEGPEEGDMEQCRKLVDLGADVIMGHGPHTVHQIEDYKDGLIIYSLGNAAMDTADDSSDYSYAVKVVLDKDGGIQSLELIPTFKETYRYVPMGTPLRRDVDTGFNVSYDEVWEMYEEDTYDIVDDEDRVELMIALKEAPWYLKTFLVVSSIIIIGGSLIIGYEMVKRKRGKIS